MLEDTVRALKAENTLLRQENQELKAQVSDLRLQVEELRIMVFGKKKQKEIDEDDIPPSHQKVKRTSESYRRPIPSDDHVTDTVPHPISECSHCHGPVSRKKTIVFFEEDIPVPTQKIIRKHVVEKGYCDICRKWSGHTPLPAARVVLGNNIQKYICHLSVMCRLSYTQVQQLLHDSYDMSVSQGEIARILDRMATVHRPEYEQLKVNIRAEPGVGLDETGYRLISLKDSAFAWVMTGIPSLQSLFLLGVSRGGGHVTDLLGDQYRGFVVSDDFGAYKKLERHQLCWAHLLRKFRDLAQSTELNHAQRQYCLEQYHAVAAIFSDLEQNRDESLRDSYTQRLAQCAVTTLKDPRKLVRVKQTLQKNISKYLTCLGNPLIPLTNNQSERSLRHLVLKRKVSFGAWARKGAENLAVLLSVLMSRKQRNPRGWFGEWVGV